MGPDGDVAAALLTELRRGVDPAVVVTRRPTPLSGGFSARLFAFDVDRPPGALVLRLPGDTGTAAREARVQSHVAALGYPAPRVVLTGGADSAFGRPFLVLERAPGRTPLDAAGPLGVPKLFREMPRTLASLMAALHVLPVGDLSEDGTATALADVAPGATRDWLERRVPPSSTPVIVHGDLHGANLLVDADGMIAVLDWELATVAPPEFDVARTACIFALLPGIARPAQRLLRRAGARSAERFLSAYATHRPLDRERLHWYDVLHAARSISVAQRDGPVSDVWRPLVPALERRIARRIAEDPA